MLSAEQQLASFESVAPSEGMTQAVKRNKAKNGRFVKKDSTQEVEVKLGRSLPFTLPDKSTASVSVDNVISASKKIKKPRQKFEKDFKLLDISRPVKLASDQKIKKKYKVTVQYIKDGKVKKHVVKFGDQRKQDYIDCNDEFLRQSNVSRLSADSIKDPFHPNFYKVNLLNGSCANSLDAYTKLIRELGL